MYRFLKEVRKRNIIDLPDSIKYQFVVYFDKYY